jgi:uncharacterized protein
MDVNEDFKLVLEDDEAYKKTKYFISGFHGLGSVGFIAMKHIIDHLEINGKKVNRIGVIKSKAAPPFIYLENERIVVPFEIYAIEEILIFLPRLPPYRHAESGFADSLIEWIVNSKQFDLILLVGGVDKGLQIENDSSVKFVPSRAFKAIKNDWMDLKNNMLSPGLMIQGPLAIMLGLLDLENIAALGILAYAERERPDIKGAGEAIKIINNLLKINCNLDELLKNADSIDDELKQFPYPQEDYNGGPPETYT